MERCLRLLSLLHRSTSPWLNTCLQEAELAEELADKPVSEPVAAAPAAANVSGIMSTVGFDSVELTDLTRQASHGRALRSLTSAVSMSATLCCRLCSRWATQP